MSKIKLFFILVTIISTLSFLTTIVSSLPQTNFQLNQTQIDSLLKQAAEGINFRCPTENGRYSSEEDCTKFYTCVNFRAHLRQCLTGLMFDSVRKRCVPQSQAVCGREELNCPVEPSNQNTHNEGFICPTLGIAGYPNTRNCSKYNLCIFGRNLNLDCPQNHMFDSPSRRCVNRNDVKCERPNDYVCPSNGLFPHPFGCDRYYKCCNGQATVEYCSSGRLFNSQRCVWSFGILERCPTLLPTRSSTVPPPSMSSQPNTKTKPIDQTSNITSIASKMTFELSNTDHDDSNSIKLGDQKGQSFEEKKLEIEKLIKESSSL